MHLINPASLPNGDPIPDNLLGECAQTLANDFANRLSIAKPLVIPVDFVRERPDNICQSPAAECARLENGELMLVAGQYNRPGLQFILAHHLIHQIFDGEEWECDLLALDLINLPNVASNKLTVEYILASPARRAKANLYNSGKRMVEVEKAAQPSEPPASPGFVSMWRPLSRVDLAFLLPGYL